MSSTEKRLVPTLLVLQAPHAMRVHVAGAFNDWLPSTLPMERDAAGCWRRIVHLLPGQHEYKFIVDGEWCCDVGCACRTPCRACVPNPYGTTNRIVTVTPRPSDPTSPEGS